METTRFDKIILPRLAACIIPMLILVQAPLLGQTLKATGRPLIRVYSPKEYHAGPQNLALAQDQRGFIYAGNNSGFLLEFDGVGWRRIEIPNRVAARSVAVDAQGRVYVGCIKNFGFLAPDAIGNLHFQSLLAFLKPEERSFTSILSIHATPNGVYFRAREFLFCWRNDSLKAWKAQTAFAGAFWVNGSLHVYQQQVGLTRLVGDSLRIAPGGESFAHRPVVAMLPLHAEKNQDSLQNEALMAIEREGLFIYRQNSLRALTSTVNELIRHSEILCSAILDDSTFALGSDNGAVVFDRAGKTLQLLNKRTGLKPSTVYAILYGFEGGLWLALPDGIARVNSIRPAFTLFDENAGLTGIVLHPVIRHKGVLYVRTSAGIFYFDQRHSRFALVSGLGGSRNILKCGNTLFAFRESLWKIEGAAAKQVKRLNSPIYSAWVSNAFPSRLYVTNENSELRIMRIENNDWIRGPALQGINWGIGTLVEERNGNLWLGSTINGLHRVIFSEDRKDTVVQRYGEAYGLPEAGVQVFSSSRGPVFASAAGLFRFEEKTQRFLPDSTFGQLRESGFPEVSALVEDSQGNIWESAFRDQACYLNVSLRRKDGSYFLDPTPFLRVPSRGIWTIFPEDDGVVWFGGVEGLFRYDAHNRKDDAVDFQARVRRITCRNDAQVVYAGAPAVPSLDRATNQPGVVLDYVHNALRFEYAAASYQNASQNRYQFFLEGFDARWSNWTTETQIDYTNLPQGRFVFRVRARNVYDHLSSEDRFAFEILAPWWRSWWASSLYAGLITLLLYGIRHFEKNRQQLRHEAELHRVETEKLQEVDHLKSRFFANLSHEFRTPLTLIMGQIDALLAEEGLNHKRAQLALASHNAERLLTLINQLLELSKFEAGQMLLRASRQNIVPLLHHLTSAFESWAAQKKITLHFETSQEEIMLWYEQDKIEKVMYNLLSNALKFTPAEGSVRVQVSVRSDQTRQSHSDRSLLITVRDSGAGIPGDRLPHIFDRFFQVDSSQTREFEGTGIGLALTQELVQIHGGGISVQSNVGLGTTFVVSLPLGKDHLKPEQIIEAVTSAPLSVSRSLSRIRSAAQPASGLEQPATSDQPRAAIADFILIVEDNADMRTFIGDCLRDRYRIVEAANGDDGFHLAQEHIPDLIICDVMMPRVDGYAMTYQIRQHQATCHIPIIMLTARAAEEDRWEGLEKGVDAYLTKPFDKKELRIRVRKLIERQRQLRQHFGANAALTPAKTKTSSLDQQFLQRIRQIIEENLENEDFGVENLAAHIGLGQRQLQRKLKALTGSSPQQCLRSMRLQRARQLLEQGAGTVTEVAFRVCYGTVAAFSEAFREEFGEPPSAVKPKKATSRIAKGRSEE